MAKNKMLASLRVTDDMHSQILKSAEEDQRTVQDQVRYLITTGLRVRQELLEANEEPYPKEKVCQ